MDGVNYLFDKERKLDKRLSEQKTSAICEYFQVYTKKVSAEVTTRKGG